MVRDRARRGRDGDRPQQRVPVPRRGAAGGSGDQRRAPGCPADADRQPQLLDHRDRAGAGPAPPRLRSRARGGRHLPGRLGRRLGGARGARGRGAGRARGAAAGARGRAARVRVQRGAAHRPLRGQRLHPRGDEGGVGDAQDPRRARSGGDRDRGARAGAGRPLRGGQRPLRARPEPGRRARAVECLSRTARGGRSGPEPLSHTARGRGRGRGAGGPRTPRSLAGARPRILRRLGQPAQGGGAQRGPDRGAPGALAGGGAVAASAAQRDGLAWLLLGAMAGWLVAARFETAGACLAVAALAGWAAGAPRPSRRWLSIVATGAMVAWTLNLFLIRGHALVGPSSGAWALLRGATREGLELGALVVLRLAGAAVALHGLRAAWPGERAADQVARLFRPPD